MIVFSTLFSIGPKKLGISRISDFYCVLLAFFCVGAASGLSSTFTNIEVHNLRIFDPTLTSVDFTVGGIGALIIYFIFPSLSKFASLKKLILISLIGTTVLTLLYIPFLETDINFLLRFSRGAALGLFYIALECYVSSLFNTPHRATLFGLSSITITLSYALGSSLISAISSISIVYIISAILFASAAAILLVISMPPEKTSVKKTSNSQALAWKNAFSLVPFIFIFCFLIGIGFSGESTYFPIFAEGLGLIEGRAALLYSFSLLGGIVMIPISSYFADHFGYEKVLLLLSALGILMCLFVSFLPSLLAVIILFFFIVGILKSFSSLSLAWVSEVFNGSDLLSTSMSIRSIVHQLGGICSPLIIGYFMATLGNTGFVYWMVIGFLLCFIALGIKVFLPKHSSKKTKS